MSAAFPGGARAYLDVETDEHRRLTVIGVFRPDHGVRQWIRPNLSRPDLLDFLTGVELLMSYNGLRFDLPVLRGELGVDLERVVPHRDLMLDCWARSLYGGLKKVEERLGIHRDTEGLNGWDAVRLWRLHRGGDREALEVLLRYNREDVENLEALARRLGIVTETPAPGTIGGAR